MAGAEWRHPAPSGTGGGGVRKGFLGLVHLDKALEGVGFESLGGEKHPKQRKKRKQGDLSDLGIRKLPIVTGPESTVRPAAGRVGLVGEVCSLKQWGAMEIWEPKNNVMSFMECILFALGKRWVEEKSTRISQKEAAQAIHVRDDEGLKGSEVRVRLDVRTFRESEWHYGKNTV